MLSYYNKSFGFYKKYYNTTFFSFILPNINKSQEFSSKNVSLLYKSNYFSCCSVIYPLFYKELSYIHLEECWVLKRYNMKNKINLNQTIILEGSVSENKFNLSLPILSFFKDVIF